MWRSGQETNEPSKIFLHCHAYDDIAIQLVFQLDVTFLGLTTIQFLIAYNSMQKQRERRGSIYYVNDMSIGTQSCGEEGTTVSDRKYDLEAFWGAVSIQAQLGVLNVCKFLLRMTRNMLFWLACPSPL